MLITHRTVEKLKSGKDRLQFMDNELTGFGVRVQPDGEKSFFWTARIQGKLYFRKLGTFPITSVSDARLEAQKRIGEAATWKAGGFKDPDPFAKALTSAAISRVTFRQLFEAYITRHVKPTANHPEKAEEELRWKLHDHFSAWLDRGADSITVEDMIAVRDACGKHHVLANRAVQLVRAVYNWGAKSTDGKLNFAIMPNPALSVTLYPEKPRKRFLQADELVRFEAELKKEPSRDLRDFLELSMATGARKSDVLGMRWQDVQLDLKRWTVPFPKNAESYNVSLEPDQITILKQRRKEIPDSSVWVFPSHSKSGHTENVKKAWYAFRKRANIPDVRIHDIRRTVGSYQAIAGESILAIGQTLGHRSAAATQRYAYLLDDAVRESKAAGAAKMKEVMAAAKKRAKSAKA